MFVHVPPLLPERISRQGRETILFLGDLETIEFEFDRFKEMSILSVARCIHIFDSSSFLPSGRDIGKNK